MTQAETAANNTGESQAPESSSAAQKTSGRTISKSEERAIAAIRRYDPKVTTIDTYDEIPDFGGGSLVLAEVYYPPKAGATDPTGPSEYQVLVRRDRSIVFNDWQHALRAGSRQAEVISTLASPDVVTAALTFVLVISYIVLVTVTTEQDPNAEAIRALGAALTTVLGFWFGRQSR